MLTLKSRLLIPILALTLPIGSGVAFGKSFFKNKVPHGAVNNCSTCHISTGTPATWNAFGLDIKDTMVGSQPDWAAVCGMDSDGDGFTNGEELLDPDCLWASGSPLPGDSANVTNPGDPDDFPADPEPEPEPDVIIEADVDEPAEDAGPEPEPDVIIEADVDEPAEDAGPEPEPDDAIEADVEAPIEDAGPAPEPEDVTAVSDASEETDASDAETEPMPEPDTIDEPSPHDTWGPSDADYREPECFDESECPDGSLCIDYVCVSQDGWTAPEPGGQDDATGPGPDEDATPDEQATSDEEDDDDATPAPSEDDGGCQGGAPSSGLLGLFILGLIATQRRRLTLSS
ncbi:MAG: hypothetical protein ACPGU1_21350 [Myxococcota bacterium]